MKTYLSITKVKVKESLSPETIHIFVTDASIMILLLLTVIQIIS